jgi:hypothetical protein
MTGSNLAKAVVVLVWLVVGTLGLAIGLEFFLKSRWADRRSVKVTGVQRLDAATKAHHPFAIQHVNPNYLFFFPFDSTDRVALSNEFVTLDASGFRGKGPEFVEDRALAFLIGGSTAFSFASSDSTTITGYLNRMQDRYFFVNAGVPSWNSTQELFRLSNQILEYEPSLVVAFDGANEMAILVNYHEQGMRFPPGTPESFGRLQALVGDIRAGERLTQDRGVVRRLFPRLVESVEAKLSHKEPVGPILELRVDAAARKYVFNLSLMNTLVQAQGGRFASVFQPIIWLHDNGPAHESEYKYGEAYQYFHEKVFSDTTISFERYDFSDLFDAHFDHIPYFDRASGADLTDSTIFVDPVHFFDAGNRIIASEIIDFVSQ